MQTGDLIEKLSAEPPRTTRATLRLLRPVAAGCALSFLVMWVWLGIRPDFAVAVDTASYWMKFAYTTWLALAGFWLVERLGRPGAPSRRAVLVSAIAVTAMAGLAAWRLAVAPQWMHARLVLGSTHTVCPWRIVALALPVLAGTLFGLRRMAPTRLLTAGLAAGLLAGSAGAWIYAFHCDESAAPFVAVWYTLGVAATGAIGAASGKWLLRW